MDNNNNKPDNNRNDKNRRNMNGLLHLVAWALVLTIGLQYLHIYMGKNTPKADQQFEISFTEFMELVEEDQVQEVVFKDGLITITPAEGYVHTVENAKGEAKAYKENFTLYTVALNNPELFPTLDEHKVRYYSPYEPQMPLIMELMIGYILPVILMVAAFSLLFRFMAKRGGGFGGIGSVGKSNAKVYMEKQTGVTFADVAGQDEAKESLEEIIDFLHNPAKYTAIGAKLPRGALLVGSPGTGKTLLAKAVAGEANVPFFSISGSGFVEMFVGVGASRVRDLFQEASKVAPCIIFMDGFDPSKGIIVLAATNRPEVLDKALLRPGRFDRRITVDRPNLAGRLKTLEVHTRKIKLSEDVNLDKIAQATAGCVGADLANMVNEAALRAVRHNRLAVNQEDLLISFEVVIAGAEKKGTVITEKEKRIIAYHEVGHALVAATW